ncbi:MAG: VOC family protein [Bacteroidetes bacterium]|nr:VOC family protein [Bacteroidota bacterium]
MTNLNFISPFFIVSDIKTSVAFYTEKLGFDIIYIGPDENPFYAMVGRDQVCMMLKAIAPDIKPVPNHTRHPWARWDAYISVTDPDKLFEEFNSKKISFHQSLKNDADGLRGFEIKDADGYVLFFGRPLDL